jgi:hypothetical protein
MTAILVRAGGRSGRLTQGSEGSDLLTRDGVERLEEFASLSHFPNDPWHANL